MLGLVQGLTEFIPVSSSAHLVLVPYLLSWPQPTLAFDIALHAGTLVAALVYFARDLWAVARGLLGLDRSESGRFYRRLALWLVVATIPVVIIGLALRSQVEEAFLSPVRTALELVATALLLFGTDAFRSRRVRRAPAVGAEPEIAEREDRGGAVWQGDWRGDAAAVLPATAADAPGAAELGTDPEDPLGRDLRSMGWRQAISIGLLQAVSLLPGVSRSGSTIAGGVWGGLTRQAATRFSFLLSIPALVGAIVVSIPDLSDTGADPLPLAAGVLTAAISGYLAIRVFLRIVATQRLAPFAWYCLAAAAVGLLGYQILGPISP